MTVAAAAGLPERLVAAGSGLLAASVFLDSAMEHYRASFRNRAMILPIAASGLAAASAGTRALAGGTYGRPTARAAGRGAALGVGLIGLGFHARNIVRRPGGVCWENLLRGAPAGAPAALVLSGLLDAAAAALARGARLERAVAGLIAAGIAGTTAEAALLHFRGAYQNRLMWAPVLLPPLASAALAGDAARGSASRISFGLLAATAAMGLLGAGLHAFGIARRMGGWGNWRQNILAGPPLPAPPAFTGLAIAALGALLAMRQRRG